MADLIVALGLVLAIEGALYALFPEGMKRLMSEVLELPGKTIRVAGLSAAIVGVVIVWLVRG